MECKFILTGVGLNPEDAGKGDSYFVATGTIDEYAEVLAQLEFPLSDADLIFERLRDWDDSSGLALLISLDGKRGAVRKLNGEYVEMSHEVEALYPFYEVNGSQGVIGDVQKFLNALNVELTQQSYKTQYYNFTPDPSNWQIPRRFSFKHGFNNLGFEEMDAELKLATKQPEAGSDDAIAMLYIARDTFLDWLDVDDFAIEAELDKRLLNPSNVPTHYLRIQDLSKDELNQRSLRARWYLNDISTRFGHDVYGEEEVDAAARYLRGLDDDVLAELTMLGFYTGTLMKPMIFALSERFPQHD